MAIVVRLQHHHIHLILNLQNENKNKMLNWLSFLSENDDPANFPKAGLYIYEVNTSSSGTFNGPDGDKTFYGTVEIISRMDENSNGLNIVTIKAYSYDMIGFMLIGRKKTGENTYGWGEWKRIY